MIKFMEEVKALGYTDKPDYAKLRSILQQGLKGIGATDDDGLDFSASASRAGPSTAMVRRLPDRSQARDIVLSRSELELLPGTFIAGQRPVPDNKHCEQSLPSLPFFPLRFLPPSGPECLCLFAANVSQIC